MAATSTSTISDVIVSAMLAERIRSQINRRCVLLNLLPYEMTGNPLSWTVKFRGRTAAGESGCTRAGRHGRSTSTSRRRRTR